MSRIVPSRVARALAAKLWPGVQSQTRVAPGVYGFSCAGHGGLIALTNWQGDATAAGLSPEHIAIARECHKTELVAMRRVGNGWRAYTSAEYTAESLRKYGNDPNVTLFECWVGEEDCDWATLCYCSEKILAGVRGTYLAEHVTREDARACLERWNEKFLGRVDGVAQAA